MENLKNESRLLFATEVFLANIPTLISDLSSAKYTLLSFSDKSRNEVKQKTSLIPAVSAAFHDYIETQHKLYDEQEKLNELETKLVQSVPPKFISVEEAYPASAISVNNISINNEIHSQKSEKPIEVKTSHRSSSRSSSENSMNNSTSNCHHSETVINTLTNNNNNSHPVTESSSQAVVTLSAEDITKVREAESLLEKEREELADFAKKTNTMEDKFEVDRTHCEEMTKHVQDLRWKYENLRHTLTTVKDKRQQYNILKEEWEERLNISREAICGIKLIFNHCRREELGIIEHILNNTKNSITYSCLELEEKKRANELELAVYQIAYKEQQAAAEEVKESIGHLQYYQRELEYLAKQQELAESKRNSISQLFMASINMSTESTEIASQKLTQENISEIKDEHRLVSVLATRVGLMEERRKSIAAALMRVNLKEKDITCMKYALEQVRDLLTQEITIEEATLHEEE